MDARRRESADRHCQTDAEEHGKPGTFKALLGTQMGPPASRFTDGAPWVRHDGVQVTQSAARFLAGDLDAAVNVTLAGAYTTGRAWFGGNKYDAPGVSCQS